MILWALLLCALIQLTLFIASFRWSDNSRWRIWFVRLLIVGMVYDNLIQGVGLWYYEQGWFESASLFRYYLRVGVLPFLVLFAFSILKEISISIRHSVPFLMLSVLFILLPLVFGVFYELVGIELSMVHHYGVTRATAGDNITTYANLSISLYMSVLALLVWWISGWKWLALGTLYSMALVLVVEGQPWGFIARSFAGLVLMVAMLKTEKYFTLPGRRGRKAHY